MGDRNKLWLVMALCACAAVLVAATTGAPADGPQVVFHDGLNPTTSLAPRHVDAASVHGSVELMSWSSPVETSLVRRQVAAFARTYPNIHVTFHPTAGDYPSAVLTRFSAGSSPDVFVVDNKFAPDWIARGMLHQLDGYVAGNAFPIAKFHPQLVTGFRDPAGHLFGVPKDYSTLALYVNRQMLADAGLKRAPRTQAELVTWARRLTTKDHVGFCIDPSWERLLVFALQDGGGIVNAGATRMRVRSAATRRAVDYYLAFEHAGTGRSPQQLGAGWCGDAIGKGQAAMAIAGNWMLPVLDHSYPDIDYEIADLPQGGVRRANLAYSPGYAISRTTKDPDAAWVLLQYLTSADGMREWTDQGLALPSRTDVAALPGRGAFERGLPDATVWQLPPGFHKVLLTADNLLTGALDGSRSPGEMVDAIDRAGSPILEAQRRSTKPRAAAAPAGGTS